MNIFQSIKSIYINFFCCYIVDLYLLFDEFRVYEAGTRFSLGSYLGRSVGRFHILELRVGCIILASIVLPTSSSVEEARKKGKRLQREFPRWTKVGECHFECRE